MPRTAIKQHDHTDCGAACLASVASHYQLYIPIAKIRVLAETDQLGTTMLGLVNAAQKLGFEAQGVKAVADALSEVPLPAIAHTTKANLHHYVVLYKVTKTHVTLMDPANGKFLKKERTLFIQEWTGALLLLLPGETFEEKSAASSMLFKFLKLIQPHRTVLLQALFGAIVYTILGLSTSVFVQKITDHVIADGNQNLLHLMGTLMVFILVFQCFISLTKNLYVMRTGQQIDVKLILGYYRHLLRLPQHFFDRMRVGEIISRMNDAVKIRIFINDALMNIVVNFLIILLSFALMCIYHWKLALLLLMSIPLYLLIYLFTNKLNKTTQRKLMEQSADLEAQLVESLNSISTIKQFGIEAFINNKTDQSFIKLLKTVYSSGKNTLGAAIATEFSTKLITIVLLWMGATSVLSNSLTVGELFSFYTLSAYFTAPISSLIGANKLMQDAIIAADRLFQIMDLENETAQRSIEIPQGFLKGDIYFENISFNYHSRNTVFSNLTLHIKSGSFTAIIGESGSGKSTLMALLQQLYQPQTGTIRVGIHLISQINRATLRAHIAVVPQQIDLFSGNVIDNIALGEEQPNMEQILQICDQLGILPFIEALPQGFHTHLGENGAALSGGEKQRIAIARALYRNPEILILDEATSSLDPNAENQVKRTIDFLVAQHKTIVVIAHRLSTIRHADRIIVLSQGKKVEEGTHLELMDRKGTYCELWANQFS